VTTANDPPADLDDLGREVLNAVQWDFPLEERPFASLGERLGVSEPEIRERLRRSKETGVLRQLSAIYDTRALGYGSVLVASRISPDRVDEAAAVISGHPGVSHNYERNHEFNLWYTLAVPPGDSIDDHVNALHRASGSLATRTLPTLKLFKIGVKLDMTGEMAADAKHDVLLAQQHEQNDGDPPVLSDREVAVILVTQQDLPLVEEPFALEGDPLGLSGSEILEALRTFRERRLMRRFAAVLEHHSAGFKANVMGVWAISEDRVEELGSRMASYAAVSHCYRRPTYPDWPYSVFTMVHGRSARDCEETIAAMSAETGISEYTLLWSVKEYKKVRLQYFTPDWDTWRSRHLP